MYAYQSRLRSVQICVHRFSYRGLIVFVVDLYFLGYPFSEFKRTPVRQVSRIAASGYDTLYSMFF